MLPQVRIVPRRLCSRSAALAKKAPRVTSEAETVSERVGFSPLTRYRTLMVARMALRRKAKNLNRKSL